MLSPVVSLVVSSDASLDASFEAFLSLQDHNPGKIGPASGNLPAPDARMDCG